MQWSSKPRTIPLTIFTQLTLDRIPTLFNQCSTYRGPLSAVVYMALVQPPSGDSGGGSGGGMRLHAAGGAPAPVAALSKANLARVREAAERISALHARWDAAVGIAGGALFAQCGCALFAARCDL